MLQWMPELRVAPQLKQLKLGRGLESPTGDKADAWAAHRALAEATLRSH
jgi:hypothetical protein